MIYSDFIRAKHLTQTFNFEGPFYVSSGCIPALYGSKKS